MARKLNAESSNANPFEKYGDNDLYGQLVELRKK